MQLMLDRDERNNDIVVSQSTLNMVLVIMGVIGLQVLGTMFHNSNALHEHDWNHVWKAFVV